MIPEPTNFFFDTLIARLTSLERDNALMQAALDALKPDWRKAQGTSGTLTPVEPAKLTGWITPTSMPYGANVRKSPEIVKDNIAYNLPFLQARETEGNISVRNIAEGRDYIWHILKGGDKPLYVRGDVVTFSKEKPDAPITPINAALWPAPVSGYSITTRHGDHGHNGYDFACPMGTPVRCGPNGGFVALVDPCPDCPPNGTPNVRNGLNNWGYGNNVVIRYAFDILPPRIQTLIPRNAFLFAQHAHLSTIAPHLKQGQTLAPYAFIGGVGSTGDSSGPHLHWELHWSEDETADFYSIRANAIDPKELVKA